MHRRLPLLTLAAIAGALLAFAASASAAPHFDGSFKVPKFETNSKIVEGPDHNIWMAVQGEEEEDVARITPAGVVTPFKLEGVVGARGIAPGPEGRIWVTDNTGVESFDPAHPEEGAVGAEITGVNGDPIVAGSNGEMFIATGLGEIFHFKPAEPDKAEPFELKIKGLSAKDIDVLGSELVIADAGVPRIVTITTAGKVTHEYPIGHPNNENKLEGASQGVAASPNGFIGFSQQAKEPEQLGVIQPGGNTLTVVPGPGKDPFGVAYGSDTAFWAARKDGAERITQSGEGSFVDGIPDKFFVRQITSGPNNTLWLTAEVPNEEFEVFRLSGLEPPVTTPPPPATKPETTIKKGPKGKVKTSKGKATVKFTFSSSAADATFECALTKKPAGKKKKAPKPKFKGCKSPKAYKLKPGKYKFSVRAVAAGVTDPSPATRSFSVTRVKLHKHGVG